MHRVRIAVAAGLFALATAPAAFAADPAPAAAAAKPKPAAPDRASIDQLDTVATELEQDAAKAAGKDADRLRALAATMKGRASRLRG